MVTQLRSTGPGWNYINSFPDRVLFSVNKPIKLLGIQHFGSDGGEHTVSTEDNLRGEGGRLSEREHLLNGGR